MSQVAIRGNITAPIELRYTQNGKAVGSVTVAENIGKDDQKRTNFHRVTLWGELAEHAANLEKGTSVIVVGRFDQRDYEDREGNKRSSWEVTADAFGPDLRFQTVTVTRAGRPQAAPGVNGSGESEPWATTPVGGAQTGVQGFSDETPF